MEEFENVPIPPKTGCPLHYHLKMEEKKNDNYAWNIKLFTEHETWNTKLSNLSNLSN